MTSVLLVDLAHIFWSAWHAMAAEEQNAAYRVTTNRCTEIMTDWRGVADGYDAIGWCVDAPPYNRLKVRTDYKAQRIKPDPRAVDQYRRIQGWLEAQGELVWKAPGFEADDLIATACHQAPESVERIDIYSSDKDLLQLVTDRVNQLPTRKDSPIAVYDPQAVFDKFGVRPDQMADLLALWGDTSDNIPGVKGIGEKKAANLLNTIGNLDAILEVAKDIKDKRLTVSLRSMINNALKELNDSRRLVALATDAPIRFEELWEPRERQNLEPPPDDQEASVEDSEEAPPEDEVPPELGGTPAPAPAPEPQAPAAEPPPVEAKAEPAPAPKANGSTNGHSNGHASSGATGATGSPPPNTNAPPDEEDEPQRPAAQAAAAKPASVNIERAEFALTYEPNSRKVAWWLAEKAFQSHVFPGINNPAQGYIILQVGRELGLTAMASLRGIKMVKGQPMIMSTLLVGIILQSGLAEYFECDESTAEKAIYSTKRKGARGPKSLSYTIEEARQAELVYKTDKGEPNNWMKRPKTMLRHRAASELARMVYPEIASGVYVFGEDLGDGVIDVEGVSMEAMG